MELEKPPLLQNFRKRMAKDGRNPMLVACDVYRPAAIDQLEFLANQENFLAI